MIAPTFLFTAIKGAFGPRFCHSGISSVQIGTTMDQQPLLKYYELVCLFKTFDLRGHIIYPWLIFFSGIEVSDMEMKIGLQPERIVGFLAATHNN